MVETGILETLESGLGCHDVADHLSCSGSPDRRGRVLCEPGIQKAEGARWTGEAVLPSCLNEAETYQASDVAVTNTMVLTASTPYDKQVLGSPSHRG